MMVSYDFYVHTYMGSQVPEQAFTAAAARAREVLDYLCRVCRVEGGRLTVTLLAECREQIGKTVERPGETGRIPGINAGEPAE